MRFRSASNCSRLKYRLVPHGSLALAAVARTERSWLAVTALVPTNFKLETLTPPFSSQPDTVAQRRDSRSAGTRARRGILEVPYSQAVPISFQSPASSSQFPVR